MIDGRGLVGRPLYTLQAFEGAALIALIGDCRASANTFSATTDSFYDAPPGLDRVALSWPPGQNGFLTGYEVRYSSISGSRS